MAYKAFKFLLKPTDEQKQSLSQMGGACRWLWNYMLSEQKKRYTSEKKFLFRNAMCSLLPELKNAHPWLKDVPSQALQQKCLDLDKALRRVFKSKFGFPKFKSKADNQDSFRIPNSPRHFKVTRQSIKMPKLGWIKWVRHRPIEGQLKSVTFKQEGDRWYAVCLCEVADAVPAVDVLDSEIIGIDLGLSSFAVTSDGEVFDLPNLSDTRKRIKKAQRKLSRLDHLNKKNNIKRSKRREKQRQKLAKLHRQLHNQRRDFHDKASRQIANANTFVVMEDLAIKNLMKNHRLADAIGQSGWRQFRDLLQQKLQTKGGDIILVDRFYPSSQLCSCCGRRQKMPLSCRTYVCADCGFSCDRDHNAAMNLLSYGIGQLSRAGTVRIHARGDTSGGPMSEDIGSHVSLNREKFLVELDEEATLL